MLRNGQVPNASSTLPQPTEGHPVGMQQALERAGDFARAEKAENTRRAYRSDYEAFRAWCEARGASALPASAEMVAAFLSREADRGFKASTIGRRVAAIRFAHRLAGLPVPTEQERVRAVIRGIRRTIGTARVPKVPATNDRLLAMLPSQANSLAALRNRALLLLGFAGAFRRSELVALDVADIHQTPEGLKVAIRRSKTDQEGTGAVVPIVRGSVACPAEAMQAWLSAAAIIEGPIFRRINKAGRVLPNRLTAQSVALIVKAHARHAGLDPRSYAGHSLRSGFLTSAARQGASIFKMIDVSRHRNVDTLRGYVRDAELFRDHAGTGLL
jgi:site-specific recombinase XerD